MIGRAAVLEHLASWEGFREGPSNENPFGPIQGIANQPYCESFADGVPYRFAGYDHRIGLTTSKTQFGASGDAYTPWGVAHAVERGEWMADHASRGKPADLAPGDQVFFAWNNGDGPAPDHVETVQAVYADGTYDTTGANTGAPNGVWRVRRDRKYLLGRRRPHLYAVAPVPPPAPPQAPPEKATMPAYVRVPPGRHLIPVAGGPVARCVVTYAAAAPVTISRAVAQPGGRALRGLELDGANRPTKWSGRNYDELRAGEESIELWTARATMWLKIEVER